MQGSGVKGFVKKFAMKRIILFLSLVALLGIQARAQKHVRSSAAGNSSGVDWANACANLTGSCAPVRGETYYVAGGSYGTRTFNTANSGTAPITIKGATAADHGADTGWSNSYSVNSADGGSPAVWGSLTFTSDYWVWDGSVGSLWDTTPGNYGFSFGTTLSRAITIGTVGSSSSCGSATHNITLAHFYGKATSSDTEKLFEEGNTYGGALANVTFSHFLIDGWQGLFMTKSGACSSTPYTGWVVEYGVMLNGFSSSANHGEWINPNERTLDGVVIRYNLFRGHSGSSGMTGTIVANNSDNNNAKIYGNVFHDLAVGNGVITGTSAGRLNNAVVYNNTFVSMTADSGNPIGGSGQGSGNVATNNLFCNTKASYGGGFTHDYSGFFSTTNTPSEAHGQVLSGCPLTSTTNYRLATETANGLTLVAPYNVDPDGNGRPGMDGIWSRGAYQFGGTAPPPQSVTISIAPTPTQIVTGSSQQFTVTVGNTSNTSVTWALTGVGAISQAGLYTASAIGSATVTATSQSDATKVATVAFEVVAAPPPSNCSGSTFFGAGAGPTLTTGDDPARVNLGITLSAKVTWVIRCVRFYKVSNSTGSKQFTIYNKATGVVLATDTFQNETASGWQVQELSTPLNVAANAAVVVAVNTSRYSFTTPYFSSAKTDSSGTLTAPQNAGTYLYSTASAMPATVWQSTNYWIDVVFSVGPAPVAVSVTPSSATLTVGGTQQFQANVTGTTNAGVTWSVNAPNGLFTATASGTFSVTVTSVADTTKSASASVTVTLPPPALLVNCQNLLDAFTAVNIPSGTPLNVVGSAGGVTASCSVALP